MADVCVGDRISVLWPAEGNWYNGTVDRIDDEGALITYDDGDAEVIDLSQEKFEILQAGDTYDDEQGVWPEEPAGDQWGEQQNEQEATGRDGFDGDDGEEGFEDDDDDDATGLIKHMEIEGPQPAAASSASTTKRRGLIIATILLAAILFIVSQTVFIVQQHLLKARLPASGMPCAGI
jgi:hypothetical protein